jgi:hypothetical protein
MFEVSSVVDVDGFAFFAVVVFSVSSKILHTLPAGERGALKVPSVRVCRRLPILIPEGDRNHSRDTAGYLASLTTDR